MLRGPALYPTVAHQWADDVGFNAKTRTTNLIILKAFQRRLDRRYPGPDPHRFNEVGAADVREFIDTGDNGARRADRTRTRYLGVVWHLYNWALDPEIALAEANPAARLRAQNRTKRARPSPNRRKVWLGEDRAKLLVATTAGDDTPIGARDAFLLKLALYTACRAEELISLRWRHVDMGNGFIMVTGKFGKIAPVDIPPALHKALLAWRTMYVAGLGHDRLDDLALVVPVRPYLDRGPGGQITHMSWKIAWGKPIRDTGAIRKIVDRRGAAIGIDLAPHDLRRSWAGILADRGMDVEVIRKALRHDSTTTTRLYLEDKPTRIEGLDDLDFG